VASGDLPKLLLQLSSSQSHSNSPTKYC